MWRRIFDQTYARGELFTLQLHPERIDFFRDALSGLLSHARSRQPGVWIATLDEIARWWEAKTSNRAQFVRDGGSFRVEVQACPDSVLIVREGGGERIMEPRMFAIESSSRPCVSVSSGSSREAVNALSDLGYIVETGERGDGYAVHLGRVENASYSTIDACRRVIDESKRPLVRFGVWPKGMKSAFSVTGDIDALTIWDFVQRFRGL
jgi:hypothetical protein